MAALDRLRDKKAFKNTLLWIDDQHDRLVQELIAWSKINSGSTNAAGLCLMEEKVVSYADRLKADVELIQLSDTEIVDKNGRPKNIKNGRSIRIFKRPDANRRVLLTGHTDTVFQADDPFQEPKWIKDGVLGGPGVADMKGGILVMLTALEAFEMSVNCKGTGWEIILSPDEETGSLASKDLLTDRAGRAHIGLTFEPALPDGSLAGARKGSGNYTVVVHGKAAHAGRNFFDGRNAVVQLSSLISDLAGLTGSYPGLTLNPAVISGGAASNIVPELAQCRFNVRLEKPEHGRYIQKDIERLIQKYDEREGFFVKLYGGINRPPKILTPVNLRLMDLIKDCGKDLNIPIDYVPTGGCCEGNNLAAAGLPNVDSLGVRGGLIHSHDEFVAVDSLCERAKLSALVLASFAEGIMDDCLGLAEKGR